MFLKTHFPSSISQLQARQLPQPHFPFHRKVHQKRKKILLVFSFSLSSFRESVSDQREENIFYHLQVLWSGIETTMESRCSIPSFIPVESTSACSGLLTEKNGYGSSRISGSCYTHLLSFWKRRRK